MYDGRADSLPSVPPGREPRRCSAVVPRPSGGMRYIGGVCRRARSPSIITGCGDETNPRILSFRLRYLRVCTFLTCERSRALLLPLLSGIRCTLLSSLYRNKFSGHLLDPIQSW
jgi:hypothetical protein